MTYVRDPTARTDRRPRDVPVRRPPSVPRLRLTPGEGRMLALIDRRQEAQRAESLWYWQEMVREWVHGPRSGMSVVDTSPTAPMNSTGAGA